MLKHVENPEKKINHSQFPHCGYSGLFPSSLISYEYALSYTCKHNLLLDLALGCVFVFLY